MKTILVVATTYPTFLAGDGTPPFVHELSKRLVDKDRKVVLLAPRRPGTKTYDIQDEVIIHRYPYFFASGWELLSDGAILPNLKKNKLLFFQIPFFLIGGLGALIQCIRRYKIDVIHCHWIITNGFLCALYKKIFKKDMPLIVTSHGGDAFLKKGILGWVGNAMKTITMKHINTMTVVSTAIQQVFTPLAKKYNVSIHVIPMGVDADTFSPLAYNNSIKHRYGIAGPFLLFVGRLAEKKGVTYLLDAMPHILEKQPQTKLLVVGGGPLQESLELQSQRLGLNDAVVFTGPIPNKELPAYFATADLFVGPSIIAKDGDSEGFGLVFVEALLSGTPVIATDILGIKDIVIDGKNGYFVKQKDSLDIAYKTLQYLQDRNLCDVRESVMHYSRKKSSTAYLQVLVGGK